MDYESNKAAREAADRNAAERQREAVDPTAGSDAARVADTQRGAGNPDRALTSDEKLAGTESPAMARIRKEGDYSASNNPSPAEQIAEDAHTAAVNDVSPALDSRTFEEQAAESDDDKDRRREGRSTNDPSFRSDRATNNPSFDERDRGVRQPKP